jgi:hypothetical protein
MFKKHIALFFALSISASLQAQNIVSVSPSTGAANVVVPLINVSCGQVNLPVSISYSATGVHTRDVEGTAGMGWNVNCGGSINRVTRSLPDDVILDNSGATVYGWMATNNTAASKAGTYTIQNNGSTCSYGQNDVDSINTDMPSNYDTEPDLFYVNAPGLSCEMVYDRVSNAFHPVNYQDLKITFLRVGGPGNNANQIGSFSITNDRGWTYFFSTAETVTQKTTTGTNGTAAYFSTKYKQYKNGITFYDSWNLTTITDANANAINLSYNPGYTRNSTDSVNLYLAGATTRSYQYSVLQAVIPQIVAAVTTTSFTGVVNARLNIGFNYPNPVSQTGQTIVTQINGMGHSFVFNYNAVSYNGHFTRAFLTSFTDVGCSTPVYYQFAYNGVNTTTNTTILPDSTSTKVDYWGYYASTASASTRQPYLFVNNASSIFPRYLVDASGTAGSAYPYYVGTSHRAVSATDIADGTLSKISYAQGGWTTLVYEPNNYRDSTISANVNGGGLRVKQIIDSAGNGATNRVIRNYSYYNPGTSVSSGVPVTLPQFGFTIPYSGSATGQALWTAASAQSDYDLSPDDHTILYAYVKMTQAGAGSTIYHNTTPGTFWQANAAPACSSCGNEWMPTVNFAASYTCPSTSGPIANLTYSYPFSPNPNYDFEQGLPISVVNYNDALVKVSESDYTYGRSYTPTTIKAFKSEDGPAGTIAKFYSQYKVYFNTSELTSTVTQTVFDSPTLSQAQATTVNYFYLSVYHKLLSKTTAMNSDGSTITTNFTYVKDFAANYNSNPNITALYELGLQNANLPVETWQTTNRGGTTNTTNASLTLYEENSSSMGTGFPPSQQFKLVQPNGESAFGQFAINTSAGTTSKDAGYFGVANFDQYDNTGYPMTADDNHKHIVTSIFDPLSNHPTAVFKNANYNEVAFNDFDSQLPTTISAFIITGSGSFGPSGSHAGLAAGLATTQTVTTQVVITKNTSAQNYIFSIWINAAAMGTLTFTGAGFPAITYTTGGWKYYEVTVAASSLSSTFTPSFTASNNISIDDILLYPDVAEATTATYDQTGHYKICQTNTNGVSAYFTNDQWGRVLYAYDQDHNIVQRNQYVSLNDYQSFNTPVIVPPANIYAGIGGSFSNSAPTSCYTNGLYYIWSFGDSTAPDTTTSPLAVMHTYADTGTYTISLSVHSPLLGTKTGTRLVTVTSLPYTSISYTNACTPGGHIPSAIATLKFVPVSSGTTYTFTTTQLQAGVTVLPNNYQITITAVGTQYNSVSNPTGWGSVIYSGPASPNCWNFFTSPVTFTSNITYTPSVNFEIQPSSCTP